MNNMLVDSGFLEVTRRNECGFETQPKFVAGRNAQISMLDSGVVKVEPASIGSNYSSDVVISSGVHGNETAPIEIVDELVNDIVSGELTVNNRLLFIIGNPVAMNKQQRFDIENMNRLFNGNHKAKTHHEAYRAAKLERYVSDFFEQGSAENRIHYDLHTAIRGSRHKKFAIYPFTDGREYKKGALELFLAAGIDTILFGHAPSGTFSYFTSHQFAADAFTVELGKVKAFGENDMSEFKQIVTVLRNMVEAVTTKTKLFSNNDFNLFAVKTELLKKSEHFKLNISDDLENFTEFTQGFQLTTDIDGGYKVEHSGEAIVFPNNKVPVGQRAGLVLEKTKL
jgi:succinylglutamate desuccinylase